MRLSGFASGMDINQMVNDLMKAERQPMQKMQQDQQELILKMADYREVNREFMQFRNNTFDSVIRRSNMDAKQVTSSNESLVSGSANAGSPNGTTQIANVTQLATSSSEIGEGQVFGNDDFDATATLASQELGEGVEVWKEGAVHQQSFTYDENPIVLEKDHLMDVSDEEFAIVYVDGQRFNVIADDTSIDENEVYIDEATGELDFGGNLEEGQRVDVTFATEIESESITLNGEANAFDLGVKELVVGSVNVDGFTEVTDSEVELAANEYFVDEATGLIRFAEGETGEVDVEFKQHFSVSTATTYNEDGNEQSETFVITGDQSLNDVMNEVNQSNLGISGFFDSFTSQISMSRTETGEFNDGDQDMLFSGSFFEAGIGLTGANVEVGKNAKLDINGLTTERQSNSFEENGVSINIHETFVDPVTIQVSNNTDDIFDTVTGFVEEYNELIDMVDGKVSEEYDRDFAPLTDEQRREMSESEIEMWEERAHSGLVRNDRLLTGALTQMRQQFYTPVDSGDPNQSFSQITEIGITTTSNYQDGGRLEIDETELRSAIEEDPEAVYQLFSADGDSNEERGIARRIRDTLAGSIEQISNRAGSSDLASNQQFTIGREIDQANEQISNFERRMQQVEERYWSQFTAMEQAMAQANAQAQQLMSQLGGIGMGGQQG